MVARVVWDDEAAGSSPVSPTSGYGIVAIIPPFQGGDTGSTPVTRSKLKILSTNVEARNKLKI